MTDLDSFTAAYIECALWSSNDESDESGGQPLDSNYSVDDIAPESLARMIADCAKFQKENAVALSLAEQETEGGQKFLCDAAQAGHDFWLNRNGHGAGFWDGDWPEPYATQLDATAKKFGECDLYVGDDGKIYCYGDTLTAITCRD